MYRWLSTSESLLQHLCLGHSSNPRMYFDYLLCMGWHCNAMNGLVGVLLSVSLRTQKEVGKGSGLNWKRTGGRVRAKDDILHRSPGLVLSPVRKHTSMWRGKPSLSLKDNYIAALMVKLTWGTQWVVEQDSKLALLVSKTHTGLLAPHGSWTP